MIPQKIAPEDTRRLGDAGLILVELDDLVEPRRMLHYPPRVGLEEERDVGGKIVAPHAAQRRRRDDRVADPVRTADEDSIGRIA